MCGGIAVNALPLFFFARDPIGREPPQLRQTTRMPRISEGSTHGYGYLASDSTVNTGRPAAKCLRLQTERVCTGIYKKCGRQ